MAIDEKKLRDRIEAGRVYRRNNHPEFRALDQQDGQTEMIVEGHASTFNQPYTLDHFKDWDGTNVTIREQVDPHAFDECDMSDVIMQYDHEGRVLARTRNGTLTVSTDETGLFVHADLSKSTLGPGLYSDIKNGVVDRMSFGFTVAEDKIDQTEDATTHDITVLRTILKVRKLYDVSAVSIPANDGTDISARKFSDGVIAEFRAERLKAQRDKAALDKMEARKIALRTLVNYYEGEDEMAEKENRALTEDEIKQKLQDLIAEIEAPSDGGTDPAKPDQTNANNPADPAAPADPTAPAETEAARTAKIAEEIRSLEAQLKEIKARKQEARAAVAQGAGKVVRKIEDNEMTEKEKRAKQFAESGRMEFRALLATGKIAKPTDVGDITDLPESAADIVDDVHAFSLTGNGSWVAPYKATEAAAADVTDGSAIAGTASTYDYVTINPSEWGVFDEISKQVAKMTPVDYQSAVQQSALIALRNTASSKIVAAITASKLAQKVTYTLDASYIRNLVLGFRSIRGKGNPVLYIGQADLATLGKVRGTNKDKAVFEIEFNDGTTLSGTIKDGGTAVQFRVLDQLTSGTQFFGQPQTIDMPMWDDYAIETDEGGEFFKSNMIGIRGLQTAGADLVAYHGMQIVSNNAG